MNRSVKTGSVDRDISCHYFTRSQSLIKGSLSTRPNTNLQIRSLQNFHYAKIIALIEGDNCNAIGMTADQQSTQAHTKEKYLRLALDWIWRELELGNWGLSFTL